jgi:hypothetical protein
MSAIEQEIKVIARLRKSDGGDDGVVVQGGAAVVRAAGSETKFDLDHSYEQSADADTVYKENVAPLVDRLFNGYNCCVIGYGASRSGKGFTWHGDGDGTAGNDGIVGSACDAVFTKMDDAKSGQQFL